MHLFRLQAPRPALLWNSRRLGLPFLGPVKSLTTLRLLPVVVCCGLGPQVSPGLSEDETLCFCFVFCLLSWLLCGEGEGGIISA